jgi:hypothetical protein
VLKPTLILAARSCEAETDCSLCLLQPSSYAIYRPDYYAAAFGAAKAADAKAMLPWELVAWHVAPTDSGGFDFGPDDVSYAPVASAIAYQKTKVMRMSCIPMQAAQCSLLHQCRCGDWLG